MESCMVQIFSVQLIETCPVLADPKLDDTMCYVCFDLPGYSMKETETLLQLETPRPGKSRFKDFCLDFSFKNSYDYGATNSREKRKALDNMLNEYHADVKFTVMCVKKTPKSSFSMEIGRAIVRLDNRIARRDDIHEESFPLFQNKDKVGSIKISTDLPSLLLSVCTEPKSVDFEVDGFKESRAEGEQGPLVVLEVASVTSTVDNASNETCTVGIASVKLDEACEVLQNPDLNNTRCYVSFDLPGFAMEETETPLALPTPRPGRTPSKYFNLTFNFRKSYDYSFDKNYDQRRKLATLLLKDHVEIPFTVVCESSDEESDFFMDLGKVVINLDSRIARGVEIQEESFPLMQGNDQVGSITISTDLPRLLLSISKELPQGAIKTQESEVLTADNHPVEVVSGTLEEPDNDQLNEPTNSDSDMETCTVQIFSVQFSETCDALKNPDLDDTKCYVFFLLPGFGNEETETPLSLRTPRPGLSRPKDFRLTYNFQRLYDYSFATSYEKRKVLAMLLLSQQSIEIPFTVVCEPSDLDSDFYMDLGKAVINLDGRIARGEDIREESFPLMLNNEQVGSIKISMNLPSLLLEVYNELPDAKKSAVRFFN